MRRRGDVVFAKHDKPEPIHLAVHIALEGGFFSRAVAMPVLVRPLPEAICIARGERAESSIGEALRHQFDDEQKRNQAYRQVQQDPGAAAENPGGEEG